MSSIRKLISQLNNEEKNQRAKDEKDFESEYRKQEEMHKRLSICKEESKKHMDGIVKALDQLRANQCAITHALEQTYNLTGLPIPHEYHGHIVNLISTIVSFMNSPEIIPRSEIIVVKEFLEKVISSTASIKNNLEEIQSKANQSQALVYKTNLLMKLMKSAADNEEN